MTHNHEAGTPCPSACPSAWLTTTPHTHPNANACEQYCPGHPQYVERQMLTTLQTMSSTLLAIQGAFMGLSASLVSIEKAIAALPRELFEIEYEAAKEDA